MGLEAGTAALISALTTAGGAIAAAQNKPDFKAPPPVRTPDPAEKDAVTGKAVRRTTPNARRNTGFDIFDASLTQNILPS